MTQNKMSVCIWVSTLLLLLMLGTGCGAVAGLAPTPSATPVPPTDTPTNTPKPTATPRPSATPDIAATALYDDLFSQVQKFQEAGHIPTTEGMYVELPEYHEEWAQREWATREWYFDYEPEYFVLTANLKWSTADSTSRISGCGVAFATQDDGRGYAIYLDKSRVYFTYNDLQYYYELGKTRGTGRLQFGNPAEAKFSLVVYGTNAYVYVDDQFIGEYSLSKDKPIKGYFGYGLISGTNKDYGTRCDITNARLWKLKP